MRWVAVSLVTLLCISTIPATTAGGDGVHWNGYVLDRNSIPNRVLIDQNAEPYSLHTGNADVIVVAFIFTTCVDVCPVITNNLIEAESQLGGIDYQFVSITVDPATDTPEVLKEYMDDRGATWPHLTANLSDMELVWDDFQISVITEEIEEHEHSENNDRDNHDENDRSEGEDVTEEDCDQRGGDWIESPDREGYYYCEMGEVAGDEGDSQDRFESTVTVVMPDGNESVNVVNPTGWNQLTAAADQNGWTVNASESEWGHFITGINGDDSPDDYSWWWELHSWNETSESWMGSSVGIDDIDTGMLAFAPNSTDDTTIPMPDLRNDTFVIVQSNGSNDSSVLTQINAWHMSLAALNSFDAPKSEWGHYMSSIEGVSAPTDYSWWWQLHYWNTTTESWAESMLGMDSLHDQMHIAWAPNSTMDSMIPEPRMQERMICHDMNTHENTSHDNQEDCENAGFIWATVEDNSGNGDHGEEMIHKLGVVYPDGTTEMYEGRYSGMQMVSAYEHSIKTLNQNEINHSMENGSVSSIDGMSSEYQLYVWHELGQYSHWMPTSDSANESILMENYNHYAWVAENQNGSSLVSPMIDDEDEQHPATSTSHSTQTFILNSDWKPKVVFTGYDWNVDLFVDDIKRAAGGSNDPHDHDDSIPGFTFVLTSASLGLAIIASRRED